MGMVKYVTYIIIFRCCVTFASIFDESLYTNIQRLQ